jgi:hypothetical protein
MITKENCIIKINKFKERTGVVDASDENIITTIHLMNFHGMDLNAALDQSSRSANDNGVDGWFYDESKKELFIYQSKLSESKGLVLKGLNDLKRASEWLEQIFIKGEVDKIPNDNHALYGLYIKSSEERERINKIHFVLISLFDINELEDEEAYHNFQIALTKSELNKFVSESLNGKIIVNADTYFLETSIPRNIKRYEINKFQDSTILLRKNSQLHLSYVSLFSLVELYRQRGDILFDKNVRLSLINTKEAKDRLVHPLEDTLESITTGILLPSIFPFYHIGVTISATSSNTESGSIFELESPSVINGCQTITISNQFLKKIEKELDTNKKAIMLDNFKKIQVICKVVVGVSDDELKEITNANNRQNPIENWQLFSNESVHIAIENSLKSIGIFYERQKGKFDSVMRVSDIAKYYTKTNGTKIQITELGQIVALCKKDLQKAAKQSEIFVNKKNHDLIFTEKPIQNYPNDIVLIANLFKCIKNGLNKYLNLPTHAANDYTQQIFKKPIVRTNVYYLAIIYYYQNKNKKQIRNDYSKSLLKIASPTLSDDTNSFFMKIISKIREWYLTESKNLTIEPSSKKMEVFFNGVFSDLGLDMDGEFPISDNAINWNEDD